MCPGVTLEYENHWTNIYTHIWMCQVGSNRFCIHFLYLCICISIVLYCICVCRIQRREWIRRIFISWCFAVSSAIFCLFELFASVWAVTVFIDSYLLFIKLSCGKFASNWNCHLRHSYWWKHLSPWEVENNSIWRRRQRECYIYQKATN